MPERRAHSHVPRRFVALVAACTGMAALSLDILLPAFPDIREEFGITSGSSRVTLLVTFFFLGLAAGQLFYGPLSDRFGRKPLLLIGLSVFVLGAIATTFSSSLSMMVIFRFVWGFGAAGPRSLSMAMVRDTCEGDVMARTMSLVMATYMVVPVLAPSLGALLLKVAPWRIVFWVPIISALVLMCIVSTMAETLPVARRRSIGLKALADAAAAVVRSRVTVGYGLATLFLFGIMSSYVGGSEAMIDEVFHRATLFPIVFGAVGLGIAATSLLSARLVSRLGLRRVVQLGAMSLLASTSLLFAFAHLAGDSPPLWLFMVIVGLMMPSVAALVPNCNTAAMVPLPHVAGMAAAILGTAATAGGAVLGAVIDGAFDGSIRPFATGVLALGILATASMLLVAQRTPVLIRIPVTQP